MGTLTSAIGGTLSNSNSFFGGLFPLVSNITRMAALVDNVSGNAEDARRDQIRAEQDLALEQLKNRQALQESHLAQSNALDKQQNALVLQQADEERRAALRRAVARQRASFGSQGVGSNGGSSEAVLLGLFEESEAEQERRNKLDQTRSAAMDNNLGQTRSLNLLQATQLAERQKLSRYF
nr:hypothetical protein 11 [Alphaproteobacteria bacterium]